MAGINSDCFTVNKRISFENKKGFLNILAAGAARIFSNSDTKVQSLENYLADTESFKLLPEMQKRDKINQHKQELFQIYCKNVQNQKTWIFNYNFKIILARIILIALTSIQTKSTIMIACLASILSLWLIVHTLSILGAGEMSQKGFGLTTWLSITLYGITLINYMNLILVSTDLHLTIPIEIDLQNFVFLMTLIWGFMMILVQCYFVADKMWLRRIYVKN